MTALGPALPEYLRTLRACFKFEPAFKHLGAYCRGLSTNLRRMSVEPIVLAGGRAVRTLQEFLTHHTCDQDDVLVRLQPRGVNLPAPGEAADDELGVVGLLHQFRRLNIRSTNATTSMRLL